VEMLKRRGVDASMALPPDFDSRFQKGEYDGAIYGHGGSVNEPYATLRLYQGRQETFRDRRHAERHGRRMNAGQPCWEDRTLASSPFRDLAMTRDFLDSLSEKLQAPYLSVPTRDDDSTKIEAY
jgi:hypothetical protein